MGARERDEGREGKDFAIAGEINPGEKTYNVSLRKSSSICGVFGLVSEGQSGTISRVHLSPVINFQDN